MNTMTQEPKIIIDCDKWSQSCAWISQEELDELEMPGNETIPDDWVEDEQQAQYDAEGGETEYPAYEDVKASLIDKFLADNSRVDVWLKNHNIAGVRWDDDSYTWYAIYADGMCSFLMQGTLKQLAEWLKI